MKNAVLVLIALMVASSAYAGANSKKVYEVLNVQATNVTPPGAKDFVLTKKEVGGLICSQQKYKNLFKQSEYTCYLSLDAFQAQAVFETLAVEELEITPADATGVMVSQKHVGNLVCTKSEAVVPNPVATYFCELN